MLQPVNTFYRAVLSPCVGICALDERGLCEGCHRSASEIAGWIHMNDDQRLHLMEQVLPLREARRA
jgi:predicted Fe-S protein YdhL (DUF1289 family)